MSTDVMSAERHVIKRQVIELTLLSAGQAQRYQDELSRIYRQRIVPLLDRRLSDRSNGHRRCRIETLELDLGVLDADNLEADFIAKVDAALCRELERLTQELDRKDDRFEVEAESQSRLELFGFFARTGCLPWWADAGHLSVLTENLEQLLDEAPEALAGLFEELTRDPHSRQRLIFQYTDSQLIALSGLGLPALRPALERDFQDLSGLLKDYCAAKGIQGMRPRQVLWDSILTVVGFDGAQYATLETFYRAVLNRVGTALGSTTLVAGLHGEVNAAANVELAALLDRIAKTHPRKNLPGNDMQASYSGRFRGDGGAMEQAWGNIVAMLGQLPTAAQSAVFSALRGLPAGAGVRSAAECVLRVFKEKDFQAVRPERGDDAACEALPVFRKLNALVEAYPAHGPADRQPLDLRFSEADAYPVANAGLVILWPFLGHFFSRLGLLDEARRFKNDAARHRAAALLQCVAARDVAPPEYVLPVNKLLCGLEVETVLSLGPALCESEIHECENLLDAVIAQAPILHDMTRDGFRGSFLLRPGMLGFQDGMGLLRVERQTYDIVLDRFPWSWEWVKLSWMEAPLRVEW